MKTCCNDNHKNVHGYSEFTLSSKLCSEEQKRMCFLFVTAKAPIRTLLNAASLFTINLTEFEQSLE